MCEILHYESVYFEELRNEQEYYWAAVVSTITSIYFFHRSLFPGSNFFRSKVRLFNTFARNYANSVTDYNTVLFSV